MEWIGTSRLSLAVPVALALLAFPHPAAAQTGLEAETRFNAGIVHLREGRAQLAVEEFKEAIRRDKENPYFYKGLGLAYARLNRLKDAVQAFEKALKLNPYYVDVRNDLGSVLVLQGKRLEGKREFMTAYNDPTNPTPEVSARNLGRLHFEEGDHSQALNWFRTSAGRNPSYPDAYLGIADTLAATGQIDGAIGELEAALAKIPDSSDLLLALGEILFRAGRLGEARLKLEETARKDPGGFAGLRAAQILRSFPK